MLGPFALPGLTIPVQIALFVVAGISAGLGRPFLRTLIVGSLAVGLPIVLLNGLIFPGARTVLLPLGPLAITREGLELGLATAGRLVAALAAATAFLRTTRPDDLMEALIERGVSHRLAFAVLAAVQAIPRVARSGERIVDGARTRGLRSTGSLRTRATALGPIVGAVAVGALLDVRDRTLALESRGFSFGGPRTAYRALAWRPIDRWTARLAVVLLLALVAAVALRLAAVLSF